MTWCIVNGPSVFSPLSPTPLYISDTQFFSTIIFCSQVEVRIEDVNDNAPSFPNSSVRISVPESHPLNSPLYVALATDPDSSPSTPIRYVLAQNSNDLFDIDARLGELYLARRLDYETQQRHSLLISALDGGGLSANLSIRVEVQDVNDNPPVFERNEYNVDVTEGARLDSQVRKNLHYTPVDRGFVYRVALARTQPPRLVSATLSWLHHYQLQYERESEKTTKEEKNVPIG